MPDQIGENRRKHSQRKTAQMAPESPPCHDLPADHQDQSRQEKDRIQPGQKESRHPQPQEHESRGCRTTTSRRCPHSPLTAERVSRGPEHFYIDSQTQDQE